MKQAQTSCRRMAIELPFVHPDKSRVVWCPRAGTPKQSVRRSSLASLGATETSPVRVRRSSSLSISSTGIREMVRTSSQSSNNSDGSSKYSGLYETGVKSECSDSDSSSSSSSTAQMPPRQGTPSADRGPDSTILPRSHSMNGSTDNGSSCGGGQSPMKKQGK